MCNWFRERELAGNISACFLHDERKLVLFLFHKNSVEADNGKWKEQAGSWWVD